MKGIKLDIIDKSNYFRGILLLIRKDFHISSPERDFVFRIGKTLGFDREFIDDSIKDLMYNEYIEDNPPKFSDPEIAKSFIIDGLKVVSTDTVVDPNEISFLNKTAENNSLPDIWFKETLKSDYRIPYNKTGMENVNFEVVNYI
ncbi:MAG: hypothetical protein V1773_03405 [bacterium]